MAQRGRPKKIFTEEKNIFLTEEKNLKIDNSPRVNMSDAEIEIKKVVKYSPNGYDIVTLQPGRYLRYSVELTIIMMIIICHN